MDVMRRLFDEAPRRLPGARLLVGFNARHVPSAGVREEAARRGLAPDAEERGFGPARVLALRVPSLPSPSPAR
jgi:hypothetical protein